MTVTFDWYDLSDAAMSSCTFCILRFSYVPFRLWFGAVDFFRLFLSLAENARWKCVFPTASSRNHINSKLTLWNKLLHMGLVHNLIAFHIWQSQVQAKTNRIHVHEEAQKIKWHCKFKMWVCVCQNWEQALAAFRYCKAYGTTYSYRNSKDGLHPSKNLLIIFSKVYGNYTVAWVKLQMGKHIFISPNAIACISSSNNAEWFIIVNWIIFKVLYFSNVNHSISEIGNNLCKNESWVNRTYVGASYWPQFWVHDFIPLMRLFRKRS